MRPAALGPEFEAALETYRRGFGVIEYFAFETESEAAQGLELHRAASLAAFELLRSKLADEGVTLTLEAEKMRAEPVTVKDFIGRADSSAGVLYTPGAFLEARAHELATRKTFSSGLEECYLRAFADPPYGLHLTPAEAQHCFETINRHLFNGFQGQLEILRWSSDWSDYFAPGLEWWGALWWSGYNPARRLVSIVAASQTD